jgi:hypothetical protein
MVERPLLILPAPDVPAARRKKRGGGGTLHLPARGRQDARISPQFTNLQQALEARRLRLQTEATGITPEEVIVLETVEPVDEFVQAVGRIEGLEWLAEVEEEDIPPDDDFFVIGRTDARREDKALRGRVFLVLTNQQALQQVQSLWTAWKSGQRLERGLAKWGNVFQRLRDVRPWGVRDRLLDTGVLADWRDRVAHENRVVPCEVELWFRRDPQRRQAARDRVSALVQSLQGGIVAESQIEEIAYHALLLRFPVASVQQLLEDATHEAALVQCEQIQFFRAAGQMAGAVADDTRLPDQGQAAAPGQLGEPVVALFDGLPLQNHRRLAGRLLIDDPDNVESDYPAANRRHGTAMASLIVHGDLDASEPPLNRRLYVRPILRPDPRDWRSPRHEAVAESALVVDLIHRAVRRLFEPTGDGEPAATQVRVINLSIGILDRLFDNSLSPLARLLDWLAWKYQVLFVVSAGNHPDAIELAVPRAQLVTMNGQALQAEVIKSVAANARHRRLLSPAEAVNVLTVGALHHDSSTGAVPAGGRAPYVDNGLPSPINAQGMGYRRAIKPEILASGGRLFLRERLQTTANAVLEVANVTCAPGHRVAAPGALPGDLSATWHVRGTSDAAALTSRLAAILYDVLDDLRTEPGGEMIANVPMAVWLKALLVHSASWGPAWGALVGVLRTADNAHHFKEYITRLLGYGSVLPSRIQECTSTRVTALGGGTLAADQAHIHRFPLPPSLSGQGGKKRLVVTLATLTPVNAGHQAWRRADVWFHPDPSRPPKSRDALTKLRLDRDEADARSVQRGTVQHEILVGNRAAAFVDGDDVEIQVSCRADAGALEEQVPYALAVTLEVAPEIGIDIYQEVKARVHARVHVVQAS